MEQTKFDLKFAAIRSAIIERAFSRMNDPGFTTNTLTESAGA